MAEFLFRCRHNAYVFDPFNSMTGLFPSSFFAISSIVTCCILLLFANVLPPQEKNKMATNARVDNTRLILCTVGETNQNFGK